MGFNESAIKIISLPDPEFLEAFNALRENLFKQFSIEKMREICVFLTNAGNDLQDKAISAFQSANVITALLDRYEAIKHGG